MGSQDSLRDTVGRGYQSCRSLPRWHAPIKRLVSHTALCAGMQRGALQQHFSHCDSGVQAEEILQYHAGPLATVCPWWYHVHGQATKNRARKRTWCSGGHQMQSQMQGMMMHQDEL